MFRTVYSANAKNPQALFSVAPHLYKGFSNAALCIAETNAGAIAAGRSTADFDGLGKENAPALTPETIAAQFPLYTTSLLNLIQTAESKLHLKNK